MFRYWLIALLLVAPASAAELKFFTLGSGEVGGNYFAAANAICDRVNRNFVGQMRCSPEATPGSIYNLLALRDGQLDFAIVQSDWQRFAYEGIESFTNTGKMEDLRSVMSLYPESITILARRASGIKTFADLLGKRIDVGHPASGRHATLRRLIQLLEARPEDFAALLELQNGAAIDELCAGRIDATILILGHPNAGTARALTACDAVLIPVAGRRISEVMRRSTDYISATIPRGTYPEMTHDIQTFAVTATVVTLASTDADKVAALVSQALKGIPSIGITAPVLATLDPEEMQTRGLTAPLHEGAIAAFAAQH